MVIAQLKWQSSKGFKASHFCQGNGNFPDDTVGSDSRVNLFVLTVIYFVVYMSLVCDAQFVVTIWLTVPGWFEELCNRWLWADFWWNIVFQKGTKLLCFNHGIT